MSTTTIGDLALVLALVSAFSSLVVVIIGVWGIGKRKSANNGHSSGGNSLMRWRVLFHSSAVFFFILALLLREV